MKTKAITAIMVTMLLASLAFYVLPVKAQNVLKIGVIGPYGWPQWDGMREGAELARDWINNMSAGGGGGINIGGTTYTVSLEYGDEHAADNDPPAGALEMERLITTEQCDVILGGFRTECTTAMREVAADYDTLYHICGSSTNRLIDCGGGASPCGACVRCDYSRYKYTFRNTPINGTTLVYNILGFISGYVLPYRLCPLYGEQLDADPELDVKTAILAEDLDWTIDLWNAFIYGGYLGPRANIVYSARTTYTPGSPYDFTADLDAMHAAEVRLVVQIYSGPDGAALILQKAAHPLKASLIGINVVSQTTEFWAATGGACQYEAFLHSSGTRSPMSTTTQPWDTTTVWDKYYYRYGHAPIYTMWGVYDSLIAYHDMLEGQTANTPPFTVSERDAIVTLLEATDRQATLGRFKYTQFHDPFSNEYGATWTKGYVRSMVTQWQAGRHEVVWPAMVPFAKQWAIPDEAGKMYPYPADVDQDGDVDITDATIIRAAGGSYAAPPDALVVPPNWMFIADVVQNGVVTIADLGQLYAPFGDSVTLPLTYCDEAGHMG